MKSKYFSMMGRAYLHCKLLVFIILLQTVKVFGQACDSSQCSCEKGDLNPSGIMIGHSHPKGAWMFSYRYMNMRMENNLSGTRSVSEDVIFRDYIMAPQSMKMDMHMIMTMYGLTNKLSLMAMFDYTALSMKMNMLPGTLTTQMNGMAMTDVNSTSMVSKSQGPGDVKVFAMYSVRNKDRHQLIFNAGINIPTGKITQNGDCDDKVYAGQRLPYMLQLGSGTFDLMSGITYQLKGECFAWGTQVMATYRPGYNAAGYCYGNELTASTWFAYRFLPWLSGSVRTEVNSTGKMYGRDPVLYQVMEPDAKPANFGGNKINGYAGLNIFLKNIANSKLSFEFGSPFYQDLNGVQLAGHSMLYAGWTVSF